MFTGIIESTARILRIEPAPPGKRLVIEHESVAAESAIGESIALSGCCLTVVTVEGRTLSFDAGPETLSRTTLGNLQPNSLVNLERSLKVGDRLGGHFVAGHVDDIGTLVDRRDQREWSDFWFQAPQRLIPQMASKGSITIDGVSLTLVDVEKDRFSVALIPHTLAVTTLGSLNIGDPVNLETDLLAKYVQQLLSASR